ncbi:VWA domain-containing protein [Clostridium sp. AM58-1XD]|nr:VWA domain-containing protein [Clostridium sp. AM58-1XD]
MTGCGSGSKSSATAGAADRPQAAATQAYSPQETYMTEAGAVNGESAYTGMEADGGMAYDRMADRYQNAYGGEYMNSEEYHGVAESGFKKVEEHPLSTFSVDVDTASYSNIRRMITRGEEIPQDAVRIEEMINYFKYDYKKPEGDIPFAVTSELSDCPWNPEHQLMLIGMQAKEIDFDNRPMSNLVFLLDVSGSMYDEDKLPLVQKSFSMLTDELTENDRVSIVTYAGYEQVVLEGARGDEKVKIREALEGLNAGGSTAGEAGINMAYEMAEKYFIPGGNNRMILATDGDLNVGVSSEEGLTKLIEEKRKGGVHLSVLGFGTGNIKDNKMEALADNGDGNYAYIDNLMEAKKVLVEEMGGTLLTVAKDVKIQTEFNPSQIAGYRLIGYENRALADEDFDDDSVDAGEIGAGHRVTALYEIIRAGTKVPGEVLKYQSGEKEQKETEEQTGGAFENELMTVNIRYKAPNGKESRLISVPVKDETYQKEMTDNLKFAGAVAEFGMLLKDSSYKGNSSYENVIDLVSGVSQKGMDDYKDEFKKLVLQVMD